jgi:hypothetical protein
MGLTTPSTAKIVKMNTAQATSVAVAEVAVRLDVELVVAVAAEVTDTP